MLRYISVNLKKCQALYYFIYITKTTKIIGNIQCKATRDARINVSPKLFVQENLNGMIMCEVDKDYLFIQFHIISSL